MQRYQMLIGAWVEAKEGALLESENPFLGRIWARDGPAARPSTSSGQSRPRRCLPCPRLAAPDGERARRAAA